MSAILRHLPFFESATTVEFQRRLIRVKGDQIIVWASLSPAGLREFPARATRFPAILDTGCNHNFVIRQSHLVEWAGIDVAELRKLRSVRLKGRTVQQLAASMWLHPNRPGRRDEFANRPPVRLEAQPAIIVIPDEAGEPRLPILGLRALRWAKLDVHIDGRRCRTTIRTARRFRLFG